MSKIEKLIKRIESFPKNFTYQELKKLLNHFGYQEFHKAIHLDRGYVSMTRKEIS